MDFINRGAELFIPDGISPVEAIQRTTHMGIAAHQDDLEIMAYKGIADCFGNNNNWFFGVVATNGAGSPRDDLYADYTDEEMQRVRRHEQKKAAFVGEYGALALLDYTSEAVKSSKQETLVDELEKLILKARPEVIYTHNPADKHDTHIALTIRVIEALRRIPSEVRPESIYGCEVWRGLDWVLDTEKVMLNVDSHPNIASALVEVFDSQICGGKRYDLATAGRRLANATYAASHGTDAASALTYAMDLTPLVEDSAKELESYVLGYIDRFREDVAGRLRKFIGKG